LAEPPAQRVVDLVSERGGDAGEEPYGPPRPVPARRERATDDDGCFTLQPGPDEQHRAAVTVDDSAEVHRLGRNLCARTTGCCRPDHRSDGQRGALWAETPTTLGGGWARHAPRPTCAARSTSAIPRNHSSRAVDGSVIAPFGSRSVRGAGDRAQTVLLLIEQAPCTGACEVPVAPIAALEPVALREQPRRHRALRPGVEPRQGCSEQGHGVGAQGRGVPAVERALAAGTGEVGANDESIGVREMKGTQHREPLDECT